MIARVAWEPMDRPVAPQTLVYTVQHCTQTAQRDRETGETERQRDREAERQTGRQADREIPVERLTERLRDRQADRQTGRDSIMHDDRVRCYGAAEG